jgi:hypothetical protein
MKHHQRGLARLVSWIVDLRLVYLRLVYCFNYCFNAIVSCVIWSNVVTAFASAS